MHRINYVFWSFLCCSALGGAGPLEQWTLRSPIPTGADITRVVAGNDRFLAVSRQGEFLISFDGGEWQTYQFPLHLAIQWSALRPAVVFGEGVFVRIGGKGHPSYNHQIQTSLDGVNWTTRLDAGFNLQFGFLGYSNGRFLASHPRAKYISNDGIQWEEKPGGHPPQPTDFVFANGRYWTVGSGIWTSVDGENWQEETALSGERLVRIAFGNGIFAVADLKGNIWRSPDGISWELVREGSRTPNTERLHDLVMEKGFFVAVGSTSLYLGRQSLNQRGWVSISGSGLNWVDSMVENPLWSIAAGQGLFVATGAEGSILTSHLGVGWTERNQTLARRLLGVAHGDGIFVVVGSGGLLATSPDGRSWIQRQAPLGTLLQSVVFGTDRFVAGGLGWLLTSADGFEWARIKPGDFNCRSVAYGNGLFVAAGSTMMTRQPRIALSQDGLSWRFVPLPQLFGDLQAVAFGDGKIVAVGKLGTESGSMVTALVSTDGISWEQAVAPVDAIWKGMTYGEGQFVAVGATARGMPRIIRSPDGIHWVEQPVSSSGPLLAVAFAEGSFVAVGDQTILVSSDGVDWVQVQAPSVKLNGVRFGNGRFTAVGENGTILQSGRVAETPRMEIERGNSEGPLRLIIEIPAGANAAVETSSDLKTWRPLSTEPGAGAERILDAEAIGAPQRFYRAVRPPPGGSRPTGDSPGAL